MAVDWGNVLAGGASGAGVGSAFGPVGTAVGAGVGAFTGLFGSKKKKKKPKRESRFDPGQQQLYDEYQQSLYGKGPFGDLYNFDADMANQVFDQNVSRPAYRNFEENVIPQITGQFRGNNLMNSSYTGEALSRAGRNVQENLDAQRANIQFQGQQNAQQAKRGAVNNILGMQTFDYVQPQANNPNVIDQILNSVGPAAAQYFANYLQGGR